MRRVILANAAQEEEVSFMLGLKGASLEHVV
jgi:hypothetical protein